MFMKSFNTETWLCNLSLNLQYVPKDNFVLSFCFWRLKEFSEKEMSRRLQNELMCNEFSTSVIFAKRFQVKYSSCLQGV